MPPDLVRELQPLLYQLRGFEPGKMPGLDDYAEVSTVQVLSPDVVYIGGFLSRASRLSRTAFRDIARILKGRGFAYLQCYRPHGCVPLGVALPMPGMWLIDFKTIGV